MPTLQPLQVTDHSVPFADGWNVNIASVPTEIADITMLDAKANGYSPSENVSSLLRSAACITAPRPGVVPQKPV